MRKRSEDRADRCRVNSEVGLCTSKFDRAALHLPGLSVQSGRSSFRWRRTCPGSGGARDHDGCVAH